ncbi:hypothetical protein ACQ4M4_06965 [Leptolyngbya sp. AN02str]|uniref:hypothetical protein n=1 Tax=Leptolyngbya sp. AN02str TaxID=3423363 RepID=UPI003D3127C8
MSVDIEVIPVKNKTFTWEALKFELLALSLDQQVSLLLGREPKLLKLSSRHEVEVGQVILPTNYYCFQLTRDNTLMLSCDKNAETYTDEQAYLDDFGRNLTPDIRAYISKCWAEVGYSYAVESWGGRTEGETVLLVAISKAIARLLDGFIVIKDDLFSLPVGVYSPSEFSSCKPMFR